MSNKHQGTVTWPETSSYVHQFKCFKSNTKVEVEPCFWTVCQSILPVTSPAVINQIFLISLTSQGLLEFSFLFSWYSLEIAKSLTGAKGVARRPQEPPWSWWRESYWKFQPLVPFLPLRTQSTVTIPRGKKQQEWPPLSPGQNESKERKRAGPTSPGSWLCFCNHAGKSRMIPWSVPTSLALPFHSG